MRPAARYVLMSLLLLVLSCSGSHDGMLRFLFDDPPTATSPADSAGAERPAPSVSSPAPEASGATQVLHSPYEDRECGACHALSASKSFLGGAAAGAGEAAEDPKARLLLAVPQLCFECHDDKTPEALEEVGETIHSPVEDGECLECHNPHKSRFPALLQRGEPFEKLCFECHDSDDVMSAEPHDALEAEKRVCTVCHDPHVSDREYLLKPGASGAESNDGD